MSFDPSRTPYMHYICKTLPCTCTRTHAKIEFQLLPCWEKGCARTFYTQNELFEHHLEAHEKPLPPRLTMTLNGFHRQEELHT